jgi:hypothetical protein
MPPFDGPLSRSPRRAWATCAAGYCGKLNHAVQFDSVIEQNPLNQGNQFYIESPLFKNSYLLKG